MHLFAAFLRIALLGAGWVMTTGAATRKARRDVWLQRSCRRVLRCLNVRLVWKGPTPSGGLIIANHLGYLDILVLGAITPVRFVAKSEVRSWPVLGLLARWAGTIFVDRARRADVTRVNREMQSSLAAGDVVGLFPEGTSSGGGALLPFKPSLLQPAAEAKHPVTLALLSYGVGDGDVSEEVCYWKDMTLVPHLWNLLGKQRVDAEVRFRCLPPRSADRKLLAVMLREMMLTMAREKENVCKE